MRKSSWSFLYRYEAESIFVAEISPNLKNLGGVPSNVNVLSPMSQSSASSECTLPMGAFLNCPVKYSSKHDVIGYGLKISNYTQNY